MGERRAVIRPRPWAAHSSAILKALAELARVAVDHDTDWRGDAMRGLAVAGRGGLDAIEALLRERQWQPIETAPRDGREFLVLTVSGPVVAHWRDESVTMIGARRGSRGYGLRSPEGWILNGVTSRTVIVDPTHWMPMPAPPTTGDDR